jgi:hypothetical protein
MSPSLTVTAVIRPARFVAMLAGEGPTADPPFGA